MRQYWASTEQCTRTTAHLTIFHYHKHYTRLHVNLTRQSYMSISLTGTQSHSLAVGNPPGSSWQAQWHWLQALMVLFCLICHELYCTVLYCTVLYCTVLYCTVLYCTALHTVPCCILYCTVLYCKTKSKKQFKITNINPKPSTLNPHNPHQALVAPRDRANLHQEPPRRQLHLVGCRLVSVIRSTWLSH